MGILESMNTRERLKQESWDRFPDYETSNITEYDDDLELPEEEYY